MLELDLMCSPISPLKIGSVEGLYKIPGINAMDPDTCVLDTLDALK